MDISSEYQLVELFLILIMWFKVTCSLVDQTVYHVSTSNQTSQIYSCAMESTADGRAPLPLVHKNVHHVFIV